MIDYRIRQGTLADADRLARLRWDFSSVAQQAAQPFDAFQEPFAAYLAEAVASGLIIWVVESADRLLGNIYVQLVRKLPRPDRFGRHWGYVTNVYIIPEMRDSGIGAALMARVQQWASDEHLEFLILWPSERSIPFYQRTGFVLDQDALVWEHPAKREHAQRDKDAIHDAHP